MSLQAFPFPDVPVQVTGIVDVRQVPNRRSTVTTVAASTVAERVLHDDPKRAAATIVGEADWLMSSTPTGTFARWPADVPFVTTAAGDLWVKASSDVTLTVVIETWAE